MLEGDLLNTSYRLGVAGFLTSDELRNAGYKANNGFRDQRAALRWIKHNIEGFGGNPGLVTLAGQSAGAGEYKINSRLGVMSLH